jgi:hypothetical protein
MAHRRKAESKGTTVVPERLIVQQFTGVIQLLLTRLARGRKETGSFVTLRDTLVPKLVSRDVRIPVAYMNKRIAP